MKAWRCLLVVIVCAVVVVDLVLLVVVLLVEGAHLDGRVLGSGRGCRHVQERVVVVVGAVVVRQGRLGRVVVLIVGLLHSVVHRHRSAGTVAILTAAPVSDVLVIVAANFVVAIAVEYEGSAAALGGHECYGRHAHLASASLN